MEFKTARLCRDLMWYEGPLLSLYMMKEKFYFMKWSDVTDKLHIWLVYEVSPQDLNLYLMKSITLREVEERSPVCFIQEGSLDQDDAAWTQHENIPEEWKAKVDVSFFGDFLEPNFEPNEETKAAMAEADLILANRRRAE